MSGPPVVLAHGFAGSGQPTWGDAGWLELLADEGRTRHRGRPAGPRRRRQAPRPRGLRRPGRAPGRAAAGRAGRRHRLLAGRRHPAAGGHGRAPTGSGASSSPASATTCSPRPTPNRWPALIEAGGDLPESPFIRHLVDLADAPGHRPGGLRRLPAPAPDPARRGPAGPAVTSPSWSSWATATTWRRPIGSLAAPARRPPAGPARRRPRPDPRVHGLPRRRPRASSPSEPTALDGRHPAAQPSSPSGRREPMVRAVRRAPRGPRRASRWQLNDDGSATAGASPAPADPRQAPRLGRRGRASVPSAASLLVGTDAVDPSTSALADHDATALLVALVLIPVGVVGVRLPPLPGGRGGLEGDGSPVDAGRPDRPADPPLPHRPLPRASSRRVQRHGGRVAVLLHRPRQVQARQRHLRPRDGRPAHDRTSPSAWPALIGADDVLIRYGGDEFVVVCPNAGTAQSAERIARRLIEALEEPFDVGEDHIRVSVPASASPSPRSTAPSPTTSSATPTPPCTRPRPGRPARSPSTTARWPAASPRRPPSAACARPSTEGQFRLYYQPVVSLQTQRMVKVEALIRWEDPERGMVSPGEFIPALEDTGLIVPVGHLGPRGGLPPGPRVGDQPPPPGRR